MLKLNNSYRVLRLQFAKFFLVLGINILWIGYPPHIATYTCLAKSLRLKHLWVLQISNSFSSQKFWGIGYVATYRVHTVFSVYIALIVTCISYLGTPEVIKICSVNILWSGAASRIIMLIHPKF